MLIIRTGTTLSQSLLPESIRIKKAFDHLSADPSSKVMQAEYVAAFPENTNDFLRVFNPKQFDQLYQNSFEYLNVLEKCGTSFPNEVINKCIHIGKNLVWDADAVGQLQHICVRMASAHPTVFLKQVDKLRTIEKDSLISFLADVENHNTFKDYQQLIDVLNSIGEVQIAERFENERSKRKSRKDH